MKTFFSLSLIFVLFSNLFAFPSSDEYLSGVAVINFTREFAPSNLQIIDGIVQFGHPGLDKIAKDLRVEQIEKIFPKEEKPDNPALIDLSRWYRIHFPEEVSVEEVVHAFKGQKFFEVIEPDPVRKYNYIPNDPLVISQWYIDKIQLYEAWNINRGNYLVEVGIVDSGYDTSHADLKDNIWINYGEDVNGDSIIDLWDWNYVDDDNNGFIDDFWGWDFIDLDNIPHDASNDGHGTLVAGIVQADTDNEIGIAGAGFNCRVMHLRCGYGGFIQAGYTGIQYAAMMGVDVINCSWGGNFYSAIEQQTINGAYQRGCVVTASAGNRVGGSAFFNYPASYEHVIAVGSTDQNDVITGFSNYNITPGDNVVDIMAPGVDMLSTSMGNAYQTTSGTSTSAPLVAGVCMLIRSVNPELTPAEVETVLVNSAVNIDSLNPQYIGHLGHGRVDAFAALLSISPCISMVSDEIIDNGNNDGRADPGETCELILTLMNHENAQPALDVSGQLSCEDQAVVITTAQSDFGDISPGAAVGNSTNPFIFTVNQTDPHFADFILTVNTEGFTFEIPFELELGRPEVLLIDDDGGGYFETYYLYSFDQMSLFVDVWDQSISPISSEEIMRYDKVFWESGNETNPIDTDEQSVIEDFLLDDGNLFLSSKNVGSDIGGSQFYEDYLHAEFVLDSVTGAFGMTGVDGHPFADNTELFLIGGSGAGNSQSMDAIEPIFPAIHAYTYNNTTYTGCISYEGDYKLAYFSFPVESVSGLNNTIPRDELFTYVIEWFDSQEEVSVNLYPLSLPIIIPANGGTFDFNIEIVNNTSIVQNFDIWTMATMPNGSQYGPIIDYPDFSAQPNWSGQRYRIQNVPANAPSGNYTYDAYIGDYPNSVQSEDHFEFTKIAMTENDASAESWNNWGEGFDEITGIKNEVIPYECEIVSISPNPFNASTVLSFELRDASEVKLVVYDIAGREVVKLVDEYKTAGSHNITWDSENFTSGIYFARLNAGDFTQTQKLLLIK